MSCTASVLALLIMLLAFNCGLSQSTRGWKSYFNAACKRYQEGKLDWTIVNLKEALREADREGNETAAEQCLGDLASTYEKLKMNSEAEAAWKELIQRQTHALW